MALNCLGAGLTTSSFDGVSTNLTLWNSLTNRAIAQPAGGSTNVVAIGSDGKEIAIPLAAFLAGGGTLTNDLYTNAGPSDTYVIGQTAYLITNNFGSGTAILPPGVLTNFDMRTWTNSNSGISLVALGQVIMKKFSSDGGGVVSDGAGHIAAGTYTGSGFFSAQSGAFVVNGSGTFANGTGITNLIHSSTVSSADATVAVALSQNPDGSTNYDLHVSSGGTTVTNISGGQGIVVTQAGGTNFIAMRQLQYNVASLAPTNVVETNGQSVIVANVLYTRTNATAAGGITALTGDVTASGSGSVVATVLGANGTLYSSLASGVLINTTSTGVPSVVTTWPNLGSNLSGVVPTGALGSGSASSSTFLRGDQTWAAIPSGSSGITNLLGTNAVSPSVGGPGNSIGFIPTNSSAGGGISTLSPTNAFVPSVIGTTGYVPVSFIQSNAFNNQSVSHSITFGGFQGTNWTTAQGFGSGAAIGVAADFDTNGLMDFALPRNTSGVLVYTNNGQPNSILNFVSASTVASTGTTLAVAVADVNGDRRPDLLIMAASTVGVFTNSGPNSSGQISFVQLGGNYTITAGSGIYAQDFNGDGTIDFIVSSSSGAAVEFTNNAGTGNFVQDTATTFPAAAHSAFVGVAAHFMGTTNWDLALPNGPVAGVLLLTNNGAGIFSISTTNLLTTANGPLTTNDFNGDGKVDVVLNNSANAKLQVFTNTGLGSFVSFWTNAVPGNGGTSYQPSTGDFNMDGLPDILSANSVGGYVILTNAGVGIGFATFETNEPTATSLLPFVGDFNNDGRPDVGWMATSQGNFQATITYNLPILYGILQGAFQGDANLATNGSITVAYSSAAVTPANAWSPGINNLGTLTEPTNYQPYSVSSAQVMNGGNVTNVNNTNIVFTIFPIQTNLISGFWYTNKYNVPLLVTVNVVLSEAASTIGFTGVADWIPGGAGVGATNFDTISTSATSLSTSMTNVFSFMVPANAPYTITNLSTGTGNSATLIGGQLMAF